MLPVGDRKVVEHQELIAILDQAVGDFGPFVLIGRDELIEGSVCMSPGRRLRAFRRIKPPPPVAIDQLIQTISERI